QTRLVETGLELIRHNKHLGIVILPKVQGSVWHTIHGGLSDLNGIVTIAVFKRPRKGHQGGHIVVATLSNVLVHLMRPGSRRHAIRCYDHGLGSTTQVVHDVAVEMLDRDLHLLGNRGRVYTHKTHHVRDGFTKVDGVLATEFVADTGEHLVGGVVGQHIKDKAFLDGLAHFVGIERHPLGRIIGIDHAVGG